MEIEGSKRTLEVRAGVRAFSFCYPNGDHDTRVVAAVKRAGYGAAVVTRWGPNDAGASLLELRRCDMYAEHARNFFGRLSPSRLAWRMSGLHPGLR
jgi:hypothetical protein